MATDSPVSVSQLFDRTLKKTFIGLSIFATFICLGVSLLFSISVHRQLCMAAHQQFDSISGPLARELALGELGVASEISERLKRLLDQRSRVTISVQKSQDQSRRDWMCSANAFSANFQAPIRLGGHVVGLLEGSATGTPVVWLLLISAGVLILFGLILMWLRSVFLSTIQKSIISPIVTLASGRSVPQHNILELSLIERELATQRKMILEQEKAVALAEKAKVINKLARQVAHDIRSPLTALEIVTAKLDQVPEDVRLLMRTATQRVKDISNNLLEMSKVGGTGAPKPPNRRSVQMLAPLVDQILSEKRSQFSVREGLNISGQIDSSAYRLFARLNQVELLRVLSNLINNAAEAILGDGKIQVTLYARDDRAVIEISDNGIGMSQSTVKTLGTKEIASDKKPGAAAGSGSGIGLVHAFGAVREAGGEIHVESALNVGTRVRISLPAEEPPSWFIPRIAADGRMITIVDDDASIHEVWNNRFADLPETSEVIHFSCLDSFTRFLNQTSIRPLVLIDYEFQGQKLTGLDVIKHFGERTADWVLVTSHFEITLQTECEKLGIRLLPKSLAAQVPIDI